MFLLERAFCQEGRIYIGRVFSSQGILDNDGNHFWLPQRESAGKVPVVMRKWRDRGHAAFLTHRSLSTVPFCHQSTPLCLQLGPAPLLSYDCGEVAWLLQQWIPHGIHWFIVNWPRPICFAHFLGSHQVNTGELRRLRWGTVGLPSLYKTAAPQVKQEGLSKFCHIRVLISKQIQKCSQCLSVYYQFSVF